jgi:SAM-dependent methyltransferase
VASGPDRELAIRKYERAAPGYDRRLRPVERYRRAAVDRLELGLGDAVLDVACGTGINFPLLRERVGSEGRVVGVDLSPDMLALAHRRIDDAGWHNVALIESAVESAELPGPFDAALFSLTHDVLQSEAALANVLSALRPGARVASFGGVWAPRWLFPVNLAVWLIARRYVTNFAGMTAPGRGWRVGCRTCESRRWRLAGLTSPGERCQASSCQPAAPAIWLHESAHRRQISAQRRITSSSAARVSQDSAHR